MPNPWDVPPKPTRPDDYDVKQEALFEAVGSALSSWQYVEDEIALIFKALVSDGLPDHTYESSKSPAERAYGSVISFEARATMVVRQPRHFSTRIRMRTMKSSFAHSLRSAEDGPRAVTTLRMAKSRAPPLTTS
jgi:hypothetical protein